MNLHLVLERLYPHADPITAFIVEDGAGGPYIAEWNLTDPQPTRAELEAAYLPAVREQKRAYIRAEVNRRASEVMPIWEFVYLINQGISDPRMTDLKEIAQRGRELEGQIDAISDDDPEAESKLEAITWS